MRTLPASIQSALDSDVLTLARCITLRRADGTIVRATDHDCDLVINEETFTASTLLEAGEHDLSASHSPSQSVLSGALSIEAITETDLLAGRWNGALVEIALVNWQDPSDLHPVWTGSISGASLRDQAIEVALEGPEAALETTVGRRYQRQCDAQLGDARCGVNLNNPAWSDTVTITGVVSDRELTTSVAQDLFVDRLKSGLAQVRTGPARGIVGTVIEVDPKGSNWVLTLANGLTVAPEVGDQMRLTIACDRTFNTCRSLYANQLNFRGCPHMPGDAAVFAGPMTDLSGTGQ